MENRNPQPIFSKACYLVACSDSTLTYPYTIIIIIIIYDDLDIIYALLQMYINILYIFGFSI